MRFLFLLLWMGMGAIALAQSIGPVGPSNKPIFSTEGETQKPIDLPYQPIVEKPPPSRRTPEVPPSQAQDPASKEGATPPMEVPEIKKEPPQETPYIPSKSPIPKGTPDPSERLH